LAVNLLVDYEEGRFDDSAMTAALESAQRLGYKLIAAERADDRLCAWIDWKFAPSWWSSEARVAEVWYAIAPDGDIAGFAAFDPQGLRFPWLLAYRDRRDVGIFGPYGVAPEHRATGIGEALLTAGLVSLRRKGYAHALIPAVGGERLIAMYQTRANARIVDEYEYDAAHRYRTVILASGGGTNAQNVIDAVARGQLPLDLTSLVANSEEAFAVQRARRADITNHAIVWDRSSESRAGYDARVLACTAETQPELVLLLGWMHLLPPEFLARFDHVLNIHPAFLPFDQEADDVTMPDGSRIPAFRGAHAMRDALAAGVAWSGATVHTVTERTDRGKILTRTPIQMSKIGGNDEFVRALRPIEHGAVLSAIRRWVFETAYDA
jgi:phosphoribosylglycinamide formyltransferase-1